MIIESVRLDNFRNYPALELSLHPGTNLFYGDNAQGKTNILEAVFLGGTTKSHRMAKDREMIRFGQEEAHLRLQLKKNGASYRIDMHLKKNPSKRIAVNGVPIRKASELIGLGHFVFFSPEDLNIIKNGPAERRRFMDQQLCQLSRVYVQDLGNYNRALLQRNALLRDLPFHPEYGEMMDLWEEQLISCGIRVIRERKRFVERLDSVIRPIHEKLTGGKEQLHITYEYHVSPEDFARQLKNSRERDIRMKSTQTGPHRDDLLLCTDTIDLRKYGSQGQQRTTALSLKLAEILLVEEESGEKPVLLLDDVLSELDSGRQRFLLESIDEIQTLITCTGIEDFLENQFRIDRLFRVKEGTAWEDSNE